MSGTYRIKKAFLWPFSAAVAFLFVLWGVILAGGEPWEKIVASVIFFISLLVVVEAWRRRIVLTDEGLTISKFFRSKKITWAEITHLGVLVVRNKAYFLLTTTRGFSMFSNLYENHAALLGALDDRLGAEKTEPEIKDYLHHPVERFSLFVMAWVAAAVVVVVTVLKWLNL